MSAAMEQKKLDFAGLVVGMSSTLPACVPSTSQLIVQLGRHAEA